MFRFYDIPMDSCEGQRRCPQSYVDPFARFIQGGPCPFNNRFHREDQHQINRHPIPLLHLLKRMDEKYNEKRHERKRSGNEKEAKNENEDRASKQAEQGSFKESKGCHEGNEESLFHPILNDIVYKVMSALGNVAKTNVTKKWRQEIDCQGFQLKNIKVKIDARALVVKAHKMEKSGDGVSSSSMRKSVPLPNNIDRERIKCKLTLNGSLVVEAPYLDIKNDNINYNNDFVKELLKSIVPGFEDLMKMQDTEEIPNQKENIPTGNKREECQDKKMDEAHVPVREGQNMHEDESTTITTNTVNAGEKKKDVLYDDQKDCKELPIGEEDSGTQISAEERGIPTNEPVVSFPDEKSEDGTEEEDVQSNNSENSFVLLSELEKEVDKGHRVSALVEVGENRKDSEEILTQSESEKGIEYNKLDVGDNESGSCEMDRCDIERTEVSKNKPRTPVMDGNTALELIGEKKAERDQETVLKSSSDNDDSFVFRLEMPSYDPKSISVSFDESQRRLVISANKESKQGTPTSESITKTVLIEDNVDASNLRCCYRDGTLSLTAPRKKSMWAIPIDM